MSRSSGDKHRPKVCNPTLSQLQQLIVDDDELVTSSASTSTSTLSSKPGSL